MSTDKIEILIEARVGEALKNIGLVKKATEETAKPSIFAQMKANWLGFTAATAGAMVALKKAFDFTKQFADFNDAAQAMAKQFGLNANEVIRVMKEASGGALSMRDSIVLVNKAFGMGITKNVDDVGKLFKIAEARADAFGISGQEAFNKLVESIGRGSPRGLKELGLLEGGMKKYQDRAEGTIDKQELLNDILENFKDIAASDAPLSLADKIDVVAASIDDLKLATGKGISIILGDIDGTDFAWVAKLQTGIIGIAIAFRVVIDQFIVGWGIVGAMFKSLTTLTIDAVKELEAMGGVIASVFTFDADKIKEAAAKFITVSKNAAQNQVDIYGKSFDDILKRYQATLKNINDLRDGNIVDVTLGDGTSLPDDSTGNKPGANTDASQAMLDASKEAWEKKRDDYLKRQQEIRDLAVAGTKEMAADLESVFSALYESELNDFKDSKEKERDYREKAANATTEIEKQKYLGLAKEEKKRGKEARDEAVKALNAQKAMGIVSATIETVSSASKAFNAMAGIPYVGPVLGGIAAAAAVAAGVARVAQISSQSVPRFATGGSFVTNGPQLMMVGDNSGGAERVTVDPLAGGGRGGAQVVNNFYGYDLNQARSKVMRTEGRGAFG